MKDCNQCGKCCIKYGDGGLTATNSEIEMWQAFHPDIYRYVHDGQIWMDPETGAQLLRCPWLQKDPVREKYSCSIYHNRPADCRHYPVTIDQMIKDDCEMIEVKDLDRPKQAQRKLDRLMVDSRPPVVR